MNALRTHLRDGTPALVRPIRSDGGRKLAEALQRLSAESRVRRFFYHKRTFSEKELHELTHCDGINHLALVVAITDKNGAEKETVAVARCIRDALDSDLGEVAFVIADEWQRQGVGTVLIDELARQSVAVGMRRWRAVFFSGNRGAQKLLGGVGQQETAEAVEGGAVDAIYLLK